MNFVLQATKNNKKTYANTKPKPKPQSKTDFAL